MKLGDPLPSFDRTEWLDGLAPGPGHASATLVHFWSSGCPLCHDGSRAVAAWRETYAADGLEVIAVYTPRPDATTTEIAIGDVRRDARSLMRIDWPCAIDRDRLLERDYDCPYAPGYFIFDREGALRHRQIGNADLERIGELLDRLVVKASSGSEA